MLDETVIDLKKSNNDHHFYNDTVFLNESSY